MIKLVTIGRRLVPGLLLEHLGLALAERSLHQELPQDGGLTPDEVLLSGQERRNGEALLHNIFLLHPEYQMGKAE